MADQEAVVSRLILDAKAKGKGKKGLPRDPTFESLRNPEWIRIMNP
jgi:hypothetical protein